MIISDGRGTEPCDAFRGIAWLMYRIALGFEEAPALENGTMKKSPRFSPEVRGRAVRMVLEHRGEHPSQWAAIEFIAGKIG
jgi:hypothetical protein